MAPRSMVVRKFKTHAEATNAQYEEWARLSSADAVRLSLIARQQAGIVDQNPRLHGKVEKINWPTRN